MKDNQRKSTQIQAPISNKYDEYFEALEYVRHFGKIKNIASEILSGEWHEICLNPDDPMDISPWDDIAYSMLMNCELVKFDFDKCPNCGRSRIQLYYQSLESEQKCGYIQICPFCKRHFGID